MANMCHVDADLVCSPGFKIAAHQACNGRGAKNLIHLIVGDGLLCRSRMGYRHFLPVAVGAGNASGDHARAALRCTPDDGEVSAGQPAVAAVAGKLFRQAVVRLIVLGNDKQAAGVHVEAVDDAGSLDAANAGQAVTTVRDKGVDERACLMPGTRVHDKSGRLVDDDQVFVFIDNIKGNVLAPWLRCHGRWQLDQHMLAGPQFETGVNRNLPLDRDTSVRDKPLEAGTADVREGGSERTVKAVVNRCDESQLLWEMRVHD